MFLNNYRRLPQGDEKEENCLKEVIPNSNFLWKIICTILSISLAASALTTASLLYDRNHRTQLCNYDMPSQYTGLRYDMPKTAEPEAKYYSVNRTLQDAVWDDHRLDSWRLFVALDDDYVTSQGLPRSMRWPWNQEKGVYILAAGHQMHCIHALRSWINDKQDGKQEVDMKWDYRHAIHCLNTLRETVMCLADDVPLYTGRLHENVHYKQLLAGRGMTRTCRNWDALRDWADKRSACYMAADPFNTSIAELDRYKYCPDGSRPWQQ